LGYFYPRKKFLIDFGKKLFGLHFGRFFQKKLILSHWSEPSLSAISFVFHSLPTSRVTRLGEFSTTGQLFTLGRLFFNYRTSPLFANFMYSFRPKWDGLHFGWVLSQTHPVTLPTSSGRKKALEREFVAVEMSKNFDTRFLKAVISRDWFQATAAQGLPDFSWCNTPKREKYSAWP
jgi:hypothetical protein